MTSLVLPDETDEDLARGQAEWWRIALANRLFSRHNDCLISMGNDAEPTWAKIQLPTYAPVFDIFAPYKNSPDFIAMSESGERFLAATSEEHGTWFHLVDCRGGQLKTIIPA